MGIYIEPNASGMVITGQSGETITIKPNGSGGLAAEIQTEKMPTAAITAQGEEVMQAGSLSLSFQKPSPPAPASAKSETLPSPSLGAADQADP